MAILNFNASENQFLGLYVKHLHVSEDSIYFLQDEPFLIKWRTLLDKREHFWKIVCTEIDDVHQFLIEESSTPDPFPYQVFNDFYPGQFAIEASSYQPGALDILSIETNGFQVEEKDVLTEISFAFQMYFIRIIAGPIVYITSIKKF